jgi:Ca2+-binding RTX toxin-like protein
VLEEPLPVEEPVLDPVLEEPLPVEEPVVEPVPVPLPPVVDPALSLVLETEDATDTIVGVTADGNWRANTLDGTVSSDTLNGRGGDDLIDGRGDGMFWAPVEIRTALVGGVDPDAVEVVVYGMPAGATLSAGRDNGDGSWTLAADELDGLTISSPDNAAFTLKVVATATDGSGLSASEGIAVSFVMAEGDLLVGGSGSDQIWGGQDDDVIYGGSGPGGVRPPDGYVPVHANDDVIDAGDGNDKVWAGSGHDQAHGGNGDDTVYGGSGNDIVWGDAGNDTLFGGRDNDIVLGGAGDDIVNGGSGDDLLVAEVGNDTFVGGTGYDVLSFEMVEGKLDLDMSKKTALVRDAHTGEVIAKNSVASVEAVVGTDNDDRFRGSSGDNTFEGGDGNDWFRGLSGADRFTGGAGADTWQWLKKDVGDWKRDHIADFEVGVDKLDLSDFLKGQGFKARYEDVVRIVDNDGAGATVLGRVDGDWVEIVELDGIDATSLTLADLGIH